MSGQHAGPSGASGQSRFLAPSPAFAAALLGPSSNRYGLGAAEVSQVSNLARQNLGKAPIPVGRCAILLAEPPSRPLTAQEEKEVIFP